MDDQLTTVDLADWLSRKLDELTSETLVELFFQEHPEQAIDFEAKAEEIFENDREHFTRRFNELQRETLEKFYPGRTIELVTKIRRMLFDEHMTKSLELHAMGRNVFRTHHTNNELLSSSAN